MYYRSVENSTLNVALLGGFCPKEFCSWDYIGGYV